VIEPALRQSGQNYLDLHWRIFKLRRALAGRECGARRKRAKAPGDNSWRPGFLVDFVRESLIKTHNPNCVEHDTRCGPRRHGMPRKLSACADVRSRGHRSPHGTHRLAVRAAAQRPARLAAISRGSPVFSLLLTGEMGRRRALKARSWAVAKRGFGPTTQSPQRAPRSGTGHRLEHGIELLRSAPPRNDPAGWTAAAGPSPPAADQGLA